MKQDMVRFREIFHIGRKTEHKSYLTLLARKFTGNMFFDTCGIEGLGAGTHCCPCKFVYC